MCVNPSGYAGHYFSAFGLLIGQAQALFAAPIVLQLHDGIDPVQSDESLTLVDKMAGLCVQFMAPGSYALLDAYYASAKVLQPFRTAGLHLISRARISTVAHAAFSARPGKHRPGRPRKWGSPVPLRALFAPRSIRDKLRRWYRSQVISGERTQIDSGYGFAKGCYHPQSS